jgi:hypothetical protein
VGTAAAHAAALVVAELTLAVMLLVGAGLLIRSFARLQRVPTGFNADRVLTLGITLSGRKYPDTPRSRRLPRLWPVSRACPARSPQAASRRFRSAT